MFDSHDANAALYKFSLSAKTGESGSTCWRLARAPLSISQGGYQLTALKEAKDLIDLLLRRFEHPCAGDESYRNQLLDKTHCLLRAVCSDNQSPHFEGMGFLTALRFADHMVYDPAQRSDAETKAQVECWEQVVERYARRFEYLKDVDEQERVPCDPDA